MAVVDLDKCLPDRRPIWSDDETRHFLNLLIESQITQHLEVNKYRNAGVFQSLVNPMRCAGYNRTFNQLRIKWKNMKKSYVDGRRALATGGSPYTACPFYDILHLLLKDLPARKGMCTTEETVQSFDPLDNTSSASDCQEDFEDNHDDSTIKLFSHFAESTNAVAVKKENSTVGDPSCVDTSQSQPFQELTALGNSDPDQLFLAMILPDLKKLSDPKKRRVKMNIQKLIDDALTQEDQ